MNSLNNSKQPHSTSLFPVGWNDRCAFTRLETKGEERFHNNARTFVFNVYGLDRKYDSTIVQRIIERSRFLVRVKIVSLPSKLKKKEKRSIRDRS